jgi:hypothetical protein
MDLVFMDWGTYSRLGNDAEGWVGVGGPAAGSPACGRPLEQQRKSSLALINARKTSKWWLEV